MANCDIIPLKEPASKACSGKCMGTCSKTPKTWLVAACGGMISLFQKELDGHLTLLPQAEGSTFNSMEEFTQSILQSARDRQFDQLIIVGSPNDVAWMRTALPETVAKSVAAEIEYPLVPAWFKPSSTGLGGLTAALENLLR